MKIQFHDRMNLSSTICHRVTRLTFIRGYFDKSDHGGKNITCHYLEDMGQVHRLILLSLELLLQVYCTYMSRYYLPTYQPTQGRGEQDKANIRLRFRDIVVENDQV